ncbi:hypothetical protein CXG81DRAFT_15045 [Caulochytrium protostelioides]|uniref:NADH dehydrogenase [ubiquinone] 1 beta subcomplex subunit 7 n=1 Tax=Caulochytrium protostelioides TaxID=1555241 RepID=A0A4P9X215_9FUNG|nr:hypothetical protein CXG81DRAFT_15045 [Caulochytrium protostelioides]|eukprot:RKO99083.1 hypothetical protein CXG81DRAFT_15045 [Caulochytrium protostelioides]
MYITEKELEKHQIPLHWRDYCSHLLPALMECQKKNNYAPWKCEEERLTWMKCQYDDHMRRMKIAERERKSAELQKLKQQDADE